MKNTTNRKRKRLGPESVRLIRGMRGGAAQIAALMHPAGTEPEKINHSYVARVINGEKPPSKRFLLALSCVLAGLHRQAVRAIVEYENPDMRNLPDSAWVGLQEAKR
jgi:hypothetical protein